MDRAAPASETPHPAQALAARLDSVLDRLLLLVAARFRILGPVTVPLWSHISRARQRLARLFANLAAGRLPRVRARCVATPRKGGPRRNDIPRGRSWLVNVIGYEAAGFREQLASVLRDPAAPATLAASPGAARTIRALCHLLGVTLPDALRPPPSTRKPETTYPRSPVESAPTTPQSGVGWLPKIPPALRTA